MSCVFRNCFLLLIMSLVLIGAPNAMARDQGDGQAEDQIEGQVLEILTRSNDYLANLKRFRVTAEFGFDVVQETGQKIEFGSHQVVTVQRPNHLRVDFSRRDGVYGHVVYDGKEIVLFNPEHAVYAKVPFKGEVDDAFNFLAEELQRPVPLRDFFTGDLSAVLLEKIESGFYVDESTVGGVLCDHLALRNDKVDFQVWIAQGDEPLPRRVVISYKNEEGQPQFWGQFLKWESSPEISDTGFSYVPSKGAERIPFAVLDVELQKEGE